MQSTRHTHKRKAAGVIQPAKRDNRSSLKMTIEVLISDQLACIHRFLPYYVNGRNVGKYMTRKELSECKKEHMLNTAKLVMSEDVVYEKDEECRERAMRVYDLLMKLGSPEDETMLDEAICQLMDLVESFKL